MLSLKCNLNHNLKNDEENKTLAFYFLYKESLFLYPIVVILTFSHLVTAKIKALRNDIRKTSHGFLT